MDSGGAAMALKALKITDDFSAKDFQRHLALVACLTALASMTSPGLYIFPALILVASVAARVATVNAVQRRAREELEGPAA